MINALNQFNSSFDRINHLHALYLHLLNDKGFASNLISDLLRSELVYTVSALDRLVHDLVLSGVMDIFQSLRTETPAFKNIGITVLNHSQLKLSANPVLEFRNIIIEKHKYLAFQEPDKISNALSLINLEQHKWQVISSKLGITENACKTTLKNIIIRRNQIVHESDIDLFTGDQQQILLQDIESIVVFVKNLGKEIFELVK